jgi:predicted peroxiredoxin
MRRRFLSLLVGLPAIGVAGAVRAQPTPKMKMKILIKSAWGSADPTQASFPFHHAKAFAEAGHEVQIFLLGEAVALMRTVVANAVVPVGWPPLAEALATVVANKIPIHF